jgi:hypothetical protein
MKCSICDKEIPAVGSWTSGNNAQPVNDGRCCNECNMSVVVPARLEELCSRTPMPYPREVEEVPDAVLYLLRQPNGTYTIGDEDHFSVAFEMDKHAALLAAAPAMQQLLHTLRDWMVRDCNGPPYNPTVAECIDLIDNLFAEYGGHL